MTKSRPGRTPHACFKRLRQATKLTQKELADLLGVSTPSVVAIENGFLILSDDMRKRLMLATGVSPGSLDRVRPVFIGERTYTNEMFERHRKNNLTKSRNRPVELRTWQRSIQQHAAYELEALTNAAAEVNKFDLALHIWRTSLRDMIRDLGVSSEFHRACQTLGIESTASAAKPRTSKRSSAKKKLRA